MGNHHRALNIKLDQLDHKTARRIKSSQLSLLQYHVITLQEVNFIFEIPSKQK